MNDRLAANCLITLSSQNDPLQTVGFLHSGRSRRLLHYFVGAQYDQVRILVQSLLKQRR